MFPHRMSHQHNHTHCNHRSSSMSQRRRSSHSEPDYYPTSPAFGPPSPPMDPMSLDSPMLHTPQVRYGNFPPPGAPQRTHMPNYILPPPPPRRRPILSDPALEASIQANEQRLAARMDTLRTRMQQAGLIGPTLPPMYAPTSPTYGPPSPMRDAHPRTLPTPLPASAYHPIGFPPRPQHTNMPPPPPPVNYITHTWQTSASTSPPDATISITNPPFPSTTIPLIRQGNPEPDMACSICLSQYEQGEEMAVLPCLGMHRFHVGCIRHWHTQQQRGEMRTILSCPYCKEGFCVWRGRLFRDEA